MRPFYQKKERERALGNLRQLGIEALRSKSYRTLSGGQQQRVLLARALCATDRILFLDEPVAGLDPAATVELYQTLEQINREKKITIVMVSHDLDMSLTYANKVLHLGRDSYYFGTKERYLNHEMNWIQKCGDDTHSVRTGHGKEDV
jgi:zinc transport system ATP-binding protein